MKINPKWQTIQDYIQCKVFFNYVIRIKFNGDSESPFYNVSILNDDGMKLENHLISGAETIFKAKLNVLDWLEGECLKFCD